MQSWRAVIALSILAAVAMTSGVLVLDPRGEPAEANIPNVIEVADGGGRYGAYASLALDASGFPVVSYRTIAFEFGLRVLHCDDANCASGNSESSPDVSGVSGIVSSSLALDANGFPVVSYSHFAGLESLVLRVLRCGNENCTAGNTIASFGTDGTTNTTLALDGAGNPVVSYSDSLSALNVLHCGNAACTSGNSFTVPNAGGGGWTASLVLDGAGNPVISFGAPGGLGVLHCNDPNCAGGDESFTLSDAGAAVVATSLALDAGGFPVVAYGESGAGVLKVLRCNDPNCAGGDDSITSPDTSGNSVSLALDAAGNPIVGYSNGGLTVLRCGNANCTAGNTIAKPDPSSTGTDISLALDAAGNPVVAYRNERQFVDDLMLLHCSSPDCLNPTWPPTPTKVADGDTDGDTVINSSDLDDDNDGCSDVQELGNDENLGGRRNPHSFWDFYDVWTHPPGQPTAWERNGVLNLFDIFAVAVRFGPGPTLSKQDAFTEALTQPSDDTSYHAGYDRGPKAGLNDWDQGPPDGSINIVDDILGVAKQFGHNCTGIPATPPLTPTPPPATPSPSPT